MQSLHLKARNWSFQSAIKLHTLVEEAFNCLGFMQSQILTKLTNLTYNPVEIYSKYYRGICAHMRRIIIQMIQTRLTFGAEHFLNYRLLPYVDTIPDNAVTMTPIALRESSKSTQSISASNQYAIDCINGVATVMLRAPHPTNVPLTILNQVRGDAAVSAVLAVSAANLKYCSSSNYDFNLRTVMDCIEMLLRLL